MNRIRKIIQSYSRELKIILAFRYTIEKDLKLQISKYVAFLCYLENGKAARSNQNYNEKSLYLVMCWYIYIYCLLRHSNFDLDKAMRVLLVCQLHSEKKLKKLSTVGCYWLYSIIS